ncbi:MAG TPA: hypothetical protein VLK35_02130 [Methylomirabilota bacterium]|nr:hypothetical protein [Methylomirabilota bacterium]
MTTTTETVEERIARLQLTDISDSRLESLTIAHPLVDDPTFERLAGASRLSRKDTIILPAHRFESLSRGRGWARKGKGAGATWGEREEKGYRVGPGYWEVGGHDGFSRKGADTWTVKHITVGDATWTIAS